MSSRSRADEIDAWEEGTRLGGREVDNRRGREVIRGAGDLCPPVEHGEWKVVQAHWSLPQAEIEALGRSLTISIDELEKIIQREQPDLSGALDSDGTVTLVFTDIVDSTGGEVLVSKVVHDLVAGPGIDFHGSREVELKGLDGPHLIYAVRLMQRDEPPIEQVSPHA